jgi:hypothetical protein
MVVVVATATIIKIIMVTLMAVKKIEEGTVVVAAVPHKEDMDADADAHAMVNHLGSATTSCAKYARKKATPHTLVGGAMRTMTTTTTTTMTREKSTLPIEWIPIGIPTQGQLITSPATLRS